jgi:hypothetical protein
LFAQIIKNVEDFKSDVQLQIRTATKPGVVENICAKQTNIDNNNSNQDLKLFWFLQKKVDLIFSCLLLLQCRFDMT